MLALPEALVATPWGRFWDNLGTSQVLLGDNLDCLWTNWWLPVDYLGLLWDHLGNISGLIRDYFGTFRGEVGLSAVCDVDKKFSQHHDPLSGDLPTSPVEYHEKQ